MNHQDLERTYAALALKIDEVGEARSKSGYRLTQSGKSTQSPRGEDPVKHSKTK